MPKTYNNLFAKICSFENLLSAYYKARKGKRANKNVQDFDFNWLSPKTANFPKNQRYVLAQRLDTTAIDILQSITYAKLQRDKLAILEKASLELEQLRILLRLSKDLKFINISSYEYAVRELDEIGRMLGGWIKQQKNIHFTEDGGG